jgi:hypothetical protein
MRQISAPSSVVGARNEMVCPLTDPADTRI